MTAKETGWALISVAVSAAVTRAVYVQVPFWFQATAAGASTLAALALDGKHRAIALGSAAYWTGWIATSATEKAMTTEGLGRASKRVINFRQATEARELRQ